MPRKHRRPTRPPAPAFPRETPMESKADGEWFVRRITGATSTKTYTCPGCHQPIRPATPHVVAWPTEKALLSDDALDERRHWHSACWQRRM